MRIWFTVLFFFFTLNSIAQLPEEALQKLSNQFPVQKLYLHTDREMYFAGETVWFKAYLLTDYAPDSISTTLYLDLLNDSSKNIIHKTIPLALGYGLGSFMLPDSLLKGNYFIRAYTATMLNSPVNILYTKKILVYSVNQLKQNKTSEEQASLLMSFFPESGNLITDMINTVAFKATNKNGLPVSVTGFVLNNQEDTVARISTVHDGMGKFEINPLDGEQYTAVLSGDFQGQKFKLPTATRDGISLKVTNRIGGKAFEINQKEDNPFFRVAYILGQMNNQVVFKTAFSKQANRYKGIVNTTNLKSGILQMTAFNKDNIPLAERLTFIDNWEYKQDAEIKTDTLGLSQRAKNHFTFSVTDSLTGDFSVAVTDADFDSQLSPGNIISSFLLTDELKGYIHNPAYYFSSMEDSVTNALDILLMTNGWRKFTWKQLVNDSLSVPKYGEPRYISISGTAYLEGTRKPFADKDMSVFISASDSGRFVQLVHTDNKGKFLLSPVIFSGYAKVLFADNARKGKKFIEIKLDSNFISPQNELSLADQNGLISFVGRGPAYLKKWEMDSSFIASQKGITLSEVKVKAIKKTAEEKLEERYVSGLFNGFSEKTIDLVDHPEVYGGPLIDYLRTRVMGISVSGNAGDYVISYRNKGVLGTGAGMAIYLDEFKVDADMIAYLPMSQVALIKVYDSFIGETGNGANGVLSVYTKKSEDMAGATTSGTFIKTINGYSVNKVFYSPDYSLPVLDNKPDNRVTLYWNPDLFFNGKKLSVPFTFYNNDRTHRFKITVEGMTADGKLVSVQRFVQ